VAFDLAAQQNEYAGCDGKDCQDQPQASNRWDKRGQACENKPDAQQQKTDISCDFHEGPFSLKKWRGCKKQ
jgi:hypothetical protein